jgi:hypothetical protein
VGIERLSKKFENLKTHLQVLSSLPGGGAPQAIFRPRQKRQARDGFFFPFAAAVEFGFGLVELELEELELELEPELELEVEVELELELELELGVGRGLMGVGSLGIGMEIGRGGRASAITEVLSSVSVYACI